MSATYLLSHVQSFSHLLKVNLYITLILVHILYYTTVYNNIITVHHNTACSQGDIRLIGGTLASEGRVEVCNQNQWGSVCNISWDLNDANVACRQAGFGSGNQKLKDLLFIHIMMHEDYLKILASYSLLCSLVISGRRSSNRNVLV